MDLKKITAILLSVTFGCFSSGCQGKSTKQIVSTEGSTSMEKLMAYLTEGYGEQNENVRVTYNPTGSSSGISAVREDRCDIGLSSRDLNDNEKENLEQTVVASDAIVVIVNPKNKTENLTLEQIANLYTGKITNWREVGGTDASVVLIGREASSGTRDSFESITKTAQRCKYSQELTSAGDVVQTVASNPNAIGYTSLAAVKDSVKIIKIENVYPSKETVQNKSYKLQRNFVFVTKKGTPLGTAAKQFFDFVTTGGADALIEHSGAIPIWR